MGARDIVYIALFAAITAALGVFPPFVLPVIGVPITAQSMGPMLAGAIIGAKRGALAIVLFLVLVAIGLPLLAGGRGGFAIILGPGGGFLLAWPLAALAIGWLFKRRSGAMSVWKASLINIVGGILLLYPFGILWLSVVAGLSPWQAAIGTIGFIPGDIIKAVAAALVAVKAAMVFPLPEAVR